MIRDRGEGGSTCSVLRTGQESKGRIILRIAPPRTYTRHTTASQICTPFARAKKGAGKLGPWSHLHSISAQQRWKRKESVQVRSPLELVQIGACWTIEASVQSLVRQQLPLYLLPRPLPRSALVTRPVRLVQMRNLGHERVIGVRICGEEVDDGA